MLKKFKKSKRALSLTTASVLIAPFLAGLATAADVAASDGSVSKVPSPVVTLTKPAWLMDLSAGIKESYDDNVFLAGADKKNLPSSYTVPAGSVAALKNKTSFVTTFSPKVGVNFAPLLGDQQVLQVLSVGYAPDFVIYHNQSSESYDSHKLAATAKGKAGDVSFNLENSVNLIDGSKYGAVYPGSLDSAYATAELRERRDQIQNRSAISFQYDQDKFFIRPIASFLYYDLGTEQYSAVTYPGYQDYVDRYDVSGGLDLGYKITPQFAATLGYRYGAQYQQQYTKDIDPYQMSSSSDYQRVLFGVEGKPIKWLKAELRIGPDFRNYGPNAAAADPDLVTYYGEASLTATITPKDSLFFKYRQNQWVSSTGKVPYFDSTYALSYKRKLTDKLYLDLGARFLESDYTSGVVLSGPVNNPVKKINRRDDTETTFSTGLTYAFNSHASVNLAYAIDLGRNLEDDIVPNSSTREFNRNVVSLGATFKF